MPDYDWSPYGEARLGGKDILITMGPIWICAVESVPQCLRGAIQIPIRTPVGSTVVPIPGLFPAVIQTPPEAQGAGTNLRINWPLNMLLGLDGERGVEQLWGRSLMHLLGHSLGLDSNAVVRNEPAVPGVDKNGDGVREPLAPDPYAKWDHLHYAPGEGTAPVHRETFPPVQALEVQDLDSDGVVERDDNCPGIANSGQRDLDGDGFGDPCDWDIDGDGLLNPVDPFAASVVSAQIPPDEGFDPFPFDTDDDGVANENDDDDDGDNVSDTTDSCPLVPNGEQSDTDGDGIGDVCDEDADEDTFPTILELLAGSDMLDAASQPEFLGLGGVCTDGKDNDLDGQSDGADQGCLDDDNDFLPNALDNCPTVANAPWIDRDGDGKGDACSNGIFLPFILSRQ